MNKKSLKVLFVEDSPRDEVLLKRHLTQCGYELESQRVETDTEFSEALKTQEWDLIISDYSLPKFNAISALFLLKAIDIDIPFIIISGTIGEDVAVEAMRLGASDYLMKDNLARLAPTIEREREEHRNRRARKEAEKEKQELIESLRESEERYRLLFSSNPIPMWAYDLETLAFLEVNDAAVKNYGYSRDEFLSMKITDIRSSEETEKLLKVIENIDSPFSQTLIWNHKRKDGAAISVEVTAHSFEFNGRPARLVLANDVSERRSLENQLRQSQKLEAIGMLAGGIAHDFNNLLTVINGYTELLLQTVATDWPYRGNLEDIHSAGERAATLTHQLLAFSRKQVLEPKVIGLNKIISDLEKLLRRVIGENIDFRTVLDDNLGSINADPGQIEQIVMNLVINSRDAMPDGGKLMIETTNVDLDDEYARGHIAVKPGRYVMLAVSDTGIGMDEPLRARIFEPFFSTKPVGKGTGLGLSTVYGIVKQSGGNIWVYSEPGQGTTFKVYLPAVDEPTSADDKLTIQIPTASGETILLVEDDDLVRKFATNILEHFGYEVLSAASGREALDICNNHIGDPIALLLTDVVMPEMSGRELAERIGGHCANIKVLYMSGYTDNAIVHQGVIDEGANFIHKPFNAETFARKVRLVLMSDHESC